MVNKQVTSQPQKKNEVQKSYNSDPVKFVESKWRRDHLQNLSKIHEPVSGELSPQVWPDGRMDRQRYFNVSSYVTACDKKGDKNKEQGI